MPEHQSATRCARVMGPRHTVQTSALCKPLSHIVGVDVMRKGLGQKAASFVHRHLWRRLPKRARRRAVEAAADLLAPRKDVPGRSGGFIAVAGVFSAATGLAQSARLCEKALRETGHRTISIDLTKAMMAQSVQDPTSPYGSVPEGPGTIVVHVNSPLLPFALLAIGRKRLRGKKIIGYWAWELPVAPPSWQRGVGRPPLGGPV